MIRFLLAFLILLIPSALVAEEQDDTIITGVVYGLGPQDIDVGTSSEVSVYLVAWRVNGGDIRTDELRVMVLEQRPDQVEQWDTALAARSLIRFSTKSDIFTVSREPVVILDKILPKPDDPDLLASAAPILDPPLILTSENGEFQPNREYPLSYEQERDWLGEPITVSLILDRNPPPEGMINSAIDVLEQVWVKRNEWDSTIREAMAEEFYQDWYDDWRAESDPELSREAFKDRLIFNEVTLQTDGSFDFIIGDDGLFWDHNFSVTGTIKDGVVEAAMMHD